MLPMKVIAYWIVFAVTFAVYGTMLAWSLPTVAASAGGLTPFDMRPGGYSYAEAEAFLAALTTEGAAFYRDVQLRLDIVYPPLLAVSVGWAIWWLLPPGWGFWRAFAVLPAVGGMIFDCMENNAINGLLQVGAAGLTEQMVSSASLYSQAKAMASTVSFLLLLLAFAWWGAQRFRCRST